jgi:excisionase family DNA binding protein
MVNAMVNDNQDREMLTVREVCQLLHVHPNTIRRWADEGRMKVYRIGPRGDRRFKREDIAARFLGEGTEDNRPSENLNKSTFG